MQCIHTEKHGIERTIMRGISRDQEKKPVYSGYFTELETTNYFFAFIFISVQIKLCCFASGSSVICILMVCMTTSGTLSAAFTLMYQST